MSTIQVAILDRSPLLSTSIVIYPSFGEYVFFVKLIYVGVFFSSSLIVSVILEYIPATTLPSIGVILKPTCLSPLYFLSSFIVISMSFSVCPILKSSITYADLSESITSSVPSAPNAGFSKEFGLNPSMSSVFLSGVNFFLSSVSPVAIS